jgi:pimeloyl-ACP methyl ester carboxylesterase
MSTFVLVPGGWHGAWCYREVTELLRRRGHTVFALTLTGLGDRAHLAHPGVGLQTHIDDVVSAIETEELSDVFLLGHSYAGFVIAGAAERLPDRIRSLIFLDATVPRDGECLMDHLSPEFQAGIIRGAHTVGDGYLVPIPTMEFLAIGPEHAAWVMRRLTPQSLRTATQTLRLGPQDPRIQRVYISCDHPSIEPTHLTKQRIASESAWKRLSLPTGHDPFISHPVSLADMLCDIAQP